MKRKYGDWTIEVNEIIHPNYGRGFRSTAYIAKNNGLKANIREFGLYYGVKSQKEMLDYTQKMLSL